MEHCWKAAILLILISEINCAPQSYHKVSHQKHEEKTEEVYSAAPSLHGAPSSLTQPTHVSNIGSYDLLSKGNSMYGQKVYDSSFNSQYDNFNKKIEPIDNLAYSSYYLSHNPRSSSYIVKGEQPIVNDYQTSENHGIKGFQEKEISYGHSNLAETISNERSDVIGSGNYNNGQKHMKLTAVPDLIPSASAVRGDMLSLQTAETFSNSGLSSGTNVKSYQRTQHLPDSHYIKQEKSLLNTHKRVITETSDSIHPSQPKITSSYFPQPLIDQSSVLESNLNSGSKKSGYVVSTKEETYRNSNGDGWTKKEHEFQPLTDGQESVPLKKYTTFKTTGSQTDWENNKNTGIFAAPGFIQSESKQLHFQETQPNYDTRHQITPLQIERRIDPSESSWSSWSSWSAWSSGPQEYSTESRKRIDSTSMRKQEPFSDLSETETRNVYKSSTYQQNEKQVKHLGGSVINTNPSPMILNSANQPGNTKGSSTYSWLVSSSSTPQQIHPAIANKQIESASLTRDDAFIESQKEFVPATNRNSKIETNTKQLYDHNTNVGIPRVSQTTISQPSIKSGKKSKTEHEEYVQLSYDSHKPRSETFLTDDVPNRGIIEESSLQHQETIIAPLPDQFQTNIQNSNIKFQSEKQIKPATNIVSIQSRPTSDLDFNEGHKIIVHQPQILTINRNNSPKEREAIGTQPLGNAFIEQERGIKSDVLVTEIKNHELNKNEPIENTQITETGKKVSSSFKKEVHNLTEITESHSDDYNSESKKLRTTTHQVVNGVGSPQNQNYNFHEQKYMQSQFGPQRNLERIEQINSNPVYDESLNTHSYNQQLTKSNSFSEYQSNHGITNENLLAKMEQNKGNLEMQEKSSEKFYVQNQESEMKQKLEDMKNHLLIEMRKKHGYQTPITVETSQSFRPHVNEAKSQIQLEHYSEKHTSQIHSEPRTGLYFQTQTMSHQEPEPCPYGQDAGQELEKSFDIHHTNENGMKSFERQRILDSDDLFRHMRHKRTIPYLSYFQNEGDRKTNDYRRFADQAEDFLGQEIEANQKSDSSFNLQQESQQLQQNTDFQFSSNNQNNHNDFGQQNQVSIGNQWSNDVDFETLSNNKEKYGENISPENEEHGGLKIENTNQEEQQSQKFNHVERSNQTSSTKIEYTEEEYKELLQQLHDFVSTMNTRNKTLGDLLNEFENINSGNQKHDKNLTKQINNETQLGQEVQITETSQILLPGYDRSPQNQAREDFDQQTETEIEFGQPTQHHNKSPLELTDLGQQSENDFSQKSNSNGLFVQDTEIQEIQSPQKLFDLGENQHREDLGQVIATEDEFRQQTQEHEKPRKLIEIGQQTQDNFIQLNSDNLFGQETWGNETPQSKLDKKQQPQKNTLTADFDEQTDTKIEFGEQNTENQSTPKQGLERVQNLSQQSNDFQFGQQTQETHTAQIFELGYDRKPQKQIEDSGQQMQGNESPQRLSEFGQQTEDLTQQVLNPTEDHDQQNTVNIYSDHGTGLNPFPQKLAESGKSQEQTDQFSQLTRHDVESGQHIQKIVSNQNPTGFEQQSSIDFSQQNENGIIFGQEPETHSLQIDLGKVQKTEDDFSQQSNVGTEFGQNSQKIESPKIFPTTQRQSEDFSPQVDSQDIFQQPFDIRQQTQEKLIVAGNLDSVYDIQFGQEKELNQLPVKVFPQTQPYIIDYNFGHQKQTEFYKKIENHASVIGEPTEEKISSQKDVDNLQLQQNEDNFSQIGFGQSTEGKYASLTPNSLQRKKEFENELTTEQVTDDKDQYSNVFDEVNETENADQHLNENESGKQENNNNTDKPKNKISSIHDIPKYTEEEYKKIIQKFDSIFDFKNALNNIKLKLGHTSNEDHTTFETVHDSSKSKASEENEGSQQTNNKDSKENSNESESKEHKNVNNNNNKNKSEESNEAKDKIEPHQGSTLWSRFRGTVVNSYSSAKEKVKEVAGKVKESLN